MSQLLCQGQRGRALKSACIRLRCRMPDQTPLCQTNEDEETKLSIKYTERERETQRCRCKDTHWAQSAKSGERRAPACALPGSSDQRARPRPRGCSRPQRRSGSPPSRAALLARRAWPARSSSRCRRRPRPLRRPPRKPKLRWVARPGRGSEFSGQITLGAALEEPRRRPVA